MEVSGRRASSVDGVDLSSTDHFYKLCPPCGVDGQQKNAQGYCSNCGEYLCMDCYKVHRNLRATRNHVFVDMADMPHGDAPSPDASDVTDEKPTDFCTEHTDETVKYYCKTHKRTACTVCVTLYHRNCSDVQNITDIAVGTPDVLDDKLTDLCTEHAGKTIMYYCKTHNKTACEMCVSWYHNNCSDVQYIPDIAAGTSDSEECKHMLLELKTLTDRLTDMEFQAGESLEAVEKASDVYSQQVQTYRDQLVTIIDKLAAEAENKKKTYVDKWISQLNSIRKVSPDHRHNIEAMTSQINNRRLEVLEKMLFVSLKQADKLTTDCHNYITSVKDIVYVRPFKFKNNSELHDMFSNVGYLGEIDTYLWTEINVQATSERNNYCNITALHILSDGRLIVADWNNLSVKLFDSNYRLKSRVKLQSEPWDMAEVSSGEVAVLLPHSQTIQFLIMSGDLKPGRTINTGCRPWSMDVSRDIIIVLACKIDSCGVCIVKLDMNGTKLQTIDISSVMQMEYSPSLYNNSDRPHSRIHPTNKNLYVSHSDGQVICMTQQGELVAEYDAMMSFSDRPGWLSIHADGSVYVSVWDSNNIHHITAECKKIDVILGHGEIRFPQSICFDREGKLLYVGEEGNNKLKVFRLFL